MQVPPQLQYNQLQTKAFFSVYKQWPIQPISNGGQYWPGQVIKIFFNGLTQGVMDPYRSHIQITVSSDVSTLPVGQLQVDNSAQSFLQQIVVSSKNRQIQRIIQYGCLAAYLTDIGISQFYSQGRQVQGLGYSNLDNYQGLYTTATTSGGAHYMPGWEDGNSGVVFPSGGGIHPTMPTRSTYACSWGTATFPFSSLSGVSRSHVNTLNSAWLSNQTQVWWWYKYVNSDVNAPGCGDNVRTTSLGQYGYIQNIRAQYISAQMSNDYIDTTSSLSKQQIRLQQSVQNGMFPAKFNNDTIYQTYIPQTLPYLTNFFDTDKFNVYQMANTNNLTGFTNLFSQKFAKGVFEPFISPTVPQCQMMNGVILSQKIPVAQRTFKIPLISAVLGLLIPQQQFVLLPLRALNDLVLQLTIDPFAMFTSGYNDIGQFDNVGMGLMQKRAFKIERIVYNLHTYQFYNPQMDQYLRVSLTSGIAINCHQWQLGNQYQIQNSQSLTNSWPVACNQQALNQILVLFYPLDYQNMSFCRKHFRISNNITKLQLRINMQYYPSQPLSGNGGNPIQLDSTGDNSVFLQQILMSNGYLFSSLAPNPRINAFNFAINDRCYNVYNTHSFYDPAMIDDEYYNWNPMSINSDTAMGMCNLHQNRYVGKAAYLYSFQPHSHSKNFLTGIDCRAAKQFDVIFTCNPENWFPRPQTMYIFTRSSVIFEYGRDGIINVSK